MSTMGEMPMPGGWAMAMVWMRMPGQSWLGVAASFVGMWVAMMVAMMLPSLIPTLWRYRGAIRETAEARVGRLTALVGVAYFFVWAVFGLIVFPLGATLAATLMRDPALARVVPVAGGVTMLVAGILQQTRWKARQLAFCRGAPARGLTLPAGAGAAWRHGVCLGVHCIRSCAGLTAVILALGVMDLRVMAAATAAITAERLAPNGERAARVTGVVVVALGLFAIARIAGLAR